MLEVDWLLMSFGKVIESDWVVHFVHKNVDPEHLANLQWELQVPKSMTMLRPKSMTDLWSRSKKAGQQLLKQTWQLPAKPELTLNFRSDGLWPSWESQPLSMVCLRFQSPVVGPSLQASFAYAPEKDQWWFNIDLVAESLRKIQMSVSQCHEFPKEFTNLLRDPKANSTSMTDSLVSLVSLVCKIC